MYNKALFTAMFFFHMFLKFTQVQISLEDLFSNSINILFLLIERRKEICGQSRKEGRKEREERAAYVHLHRKGPQPATR
jgi:hypothetical protein